MSFTEVLMNTFVKNVERNESGQITAPKDRAAVGNFAGIACIVCNTMLCLAKGGIGLFAGSVSIVADAANNLADASSNIIGMMGFRLAAKPPDADHPYGHGRYEYLAGLCVAALIMVVGVELLKESVDKVLHPQPVEFSWALVVVLALSICVKLWMAAFNHKLGDLISSSTLEATAVDSRNDCISTGAVLLAALISHFFGIELDAFMGVGVALFILWSGFQLVRETVSPLLGGPPEPELVEQIKDRMMSHPEVLGIHDLIVHDYGPGRVFASVHAEVAAEVDVLESHEVIDLIEYEFRTEDALEVVIHLDPIVTKDPRVAELRGWMAELVRGIDERMTIHDFRMVPGEHNTNLIFDCVAPFDCGFEPDELKAEIRKRVHAEHSDFSCVITVDRSFVGE